MGFNLKEENRVVAPNGDIGFWVNGRFQTFSPRVFKEAEINGKGQDELIEKELARHLKEVFSFKHW